MVSWFLTVMLSNNINPLILLDHNINIRAKVEAQMVVVGIGLEAVEVFSCRVAEAI